MQASCGQRVFPGTAAQDTQIKSITSVMEPPLTLPPLQVPSPEAASVTTGPSHPVVVFLCYCHLPPSSSTATQRTTSSMSALCQRCLEHCRPRRGKWPGTDWNSRRQVRRKVPEVIGRLGAALGDKRKQVPRGHLHPSQATPKTGGGG